MTSSSGSFGSSAPADVPGVRFGRVVRHEDERGSFRELWRGSTIGHLDPSDAGAAADSEVRFVQCNLSTSAPGVLRGLHYHRRQLDYWVVSTGRAFVALVDVRPVLDGEGPAHVETRELAADDWVVIPAGVAHGFLALERLEVVYLVTNEFDGADELGFAWDDPEVGVPWPVLSVTSDGRPILSERDRSNPPLAELVRTIREGG
jgi:dTDP-4-dehydrorhamnose 3,5-epimerase